MTTPQPEDIALLHGSWSDGNTSVENRRGEWIPSIPLPWPLLAGYRCSCGRRSWTLPGYQGHYALEHILALAPWVRSETRRFWRAQWRQNRGTQPGDTP
jgi:hypothetical protein